METSTLVFKLFDLEVIIDKYGITIIQLNKSGLDDEISLTMKEWNELVNAVQAKQAS